MISEVPTWKIGGYLFRMYRIDHLPRHVHVLRDGVQLDRFDVEGWRFMDGKIGRHRGRVLRAIEDLARRGAFDEGEDDG